MKKGIIYFLAVIFAVFIVGNSYEMALGQEISNTTISLQTTAKNSHFHQNVEKKQHKKNFEKFLKTTVTEDNFQVLDTDIITFVAALSLFSSLIFLLNGKSDFTCFNPEVVLTSKRYLVLRDLRI